MSRRRWSVLGMVGVLAVAATASWWLARGPAATGDAGHNHAGAATSDTRTAVTVDSATAARIGITYATAVRAPLARELRAVGTVVPDEGRLHSVSPKVDGWIERLWVNTTGQFVREGEPLFSVYSPQLVAAQEEYLLARRLAAAAAGPDSDALVHAAARRLEYWDISARELSAIAAEGQPRRALTFYSPISGYVLERRVVAGQRIMSGEHTLALADLSTVWVEGEVFEQDAAMLREGVPVEMRFDAVDGLRRQARVAYVYPTVDDATRTLRIRVVLDNRDGRLKPGMYASLVLRPSEADALVVPRSALLSTGVRDLVFVRMADGMLMPHEVRVGRRSDTWVEILDGVAVGDVVVASATFLVDAESNLRSALGAMAMMPLAPPTSRDGHERH